MNGGQTSNALFEASLNSEERLEDVLILVRIIETKSQPVSLAIAESTNSQTQLKVETFVQMMIFRKIRGSF